MNNTTKPREHSYYGQTDRSSLSKTMKIPPKISQSHVQNHYRTLDDL